MYMKGLTQEQINKIGEKIQKDESFLEQLKNNPKAALKALDIETEVNINLMDNVNINTHKNK